MSSKTTTSSPWARNAEAELPEKDLIWCKLVFASKRLLSGQVDKLYNRDGKFRRLNTNGRIDMSDPKNLDIADMAIIFVRDDGMLFGAPECQENSVYKKFEKRWIGFARMPFLSDDKSFKPMGLYGSEEEYTAEDYAVVRFLSKILG